MLEPTHNIDVPALRKELEFITANRDCWRQEVWAERTSCGTVACLAGNTVLHHYPDEQIRWEPVIIVDPEDNKRIVSQMGSVIDPELARSKGYATDLVTVSEAARLKLGLTATQARQMFSGDNTLRTLWNLANQFSNDEIEVPEELK